jgi:hypothetical membrane protein
MDDTRMRSRRRAIWLAWGAIGGVVVFNLGWLLAGALQGGSYSVASHDVSDLGALTARFPWVMLTAQVIAGTLIIAFALFALGPALAVPGRGPALERRTGDGYLQRSAIVLVSVGVATLALRVRALARSRDVVLQR